MFFRGKMLFKFAMVNWDSYGSQKAFACLATFRKLLKLFYDFHFFTFVFLTNVMIYELFQNLDIPLLYLSFHHVLFDDIPCKELLNFRLCLILHGF